MEEFRKTDKELKEALSPELYHVAREKGTERAFTGKYHYSKEKGVYVCAVCGNPIFSSNAKFESGTGWPSFYEPASRDAVKLTSDESSGMHRTEVTCGRCGSHLGHVFDDGPEALPDGTKATGKRYCINSVCLDLKKEDMG